VPSLCFLSLLSLKSISLIFLSSLLLTGTVVCPRITQSLQSQLSNVPTFHLQSSVIEMRSSAFITAALAGAAFAWPWEQRDSKSQSAARALLPSGLPLPQHLAPISRSSRSVSQPYYNTGSGHIYPTGSARSASRLSSGGTGVRIGGGIFPPGPTGTGSIVTGTGGGSGASPSLGVPQPLTTTITSDVTSTITTFTTGVTTITNTISESTRNLMSLSLYTNVFQLPSSPALAQSQP